MVSKMVTLSSLKYVGKIVSSVCGEEHCVMTLLKRAAGETVLSVE